MSKRPPEKRPKRRPTPARAGGPAASKGTPAPARALLDDTTSGASSSPAVPEVTLRDATGGAWTVSVRGRGRSGSPSGRASLLLLAFEPSDEGGAELESMVVAESLADLTEEQLIEALKRGRPPRAPGSRKEIFPEVGGRRRLRDS